MRREQPFFRKVLLPLPNLISLLAHTQLVTVPAVPADVTPDAGRGVAFGAEYLRVGHGRRGLRGEEVRAGADGEQEPEGGDMSDGSFHGYGILALPEIRR